MAQQRSSRSAHKVLMRDRKAERQALSASILAFRQQQAAEEVEVLVGLANRYAADLARWKRKAKAIRGLAPRVPRPPVSKQLLGVRDDNQQRRADGSIVIQSRVAHRAMLKTQRYLNQENAHAQ